MDTKHKYVIGTSGYSFGDWVGTFYPADTKQRDMLARYVTCFQTVEINFSFYRLPPARTMDAIARKAPEGFTFWVKANQATTHEGERGVRDDFLAGVEPMREAGKLAGLLFQFPQRFHRTIANRKYLAAVLGDYEHLPCAVEFRHASWEHPSVPDGLRERNVTIVIPDVPALPGLFRMGAAATSKTGYLRLHSRDAEKWYGPEGADRYDYSYRPEELTELVEAWEDLDESMDEIYAFFNNCHHGQAAQNAESLRRILGQV
ncbi:MAG TPA: DUF72 domain-containing protein [Phycisphaerae bacterium]|nr:DUF72 domain-containing protein [Phycisphaerae bacterium]